MISSGAEACTVPYSVSTRVAVGRMSTAPSTIACVALTLTMRAPCAVSSATNRKTNDSATAEEVRGLEK